MFLLKIDIDMLKKCLKGATVEAIDKELVKLQKIDTDLLKNMILLLYLIGTELQKKFKML